MRRATLAVGLLVLCTVGGCPERDPPPYVVRSGTVEGARADTGELTVRGGGLWSDRAKDRLISCLLTNDAETYVNDKLSSFDAIAIGDTLELLGHRKSDPRGERFIVSFAYISRNEPLPPEPDLSPPPTQPTSNPSER